MALEEAGIALDPVQGLVQDLDLGGEDPDQDLTQEDAPNRDLTLEIAQSLDLLGTLEETDLGLDQHPDPRIIEIKTEIDLLQEIEMYQDLVPALVLAPDLDQEVIKDTKSSGFDSSRCFLLQYDILSF